MCRITQESCMILRLHFSDVCAECNYAYACMGITLHTFYDAKAPHPCKTLYQKCIIKSCHTVYQLQCCVYVLGRRLKLSSILSQLQDQYLQHVPEAGKIYVVHCSCSNDHTCSIPLWSATAPSTATLELLPIPWRRASLSPGKVCITS